MILITHNVHHAYSVGDMFTMLNRDRNLGAFAKGGIGRQEVPGLGRRQGTRSIDGGTGGVRRRLKTGAAAPEGFADAPA